MPHGSLPSRIGAEPILSLDQVNATWLSHVLTNAGHEFGRHISDVQVNPLGGTWSHNAQLNISYRHPRSSLWPTGLFLKLAGGPDSSFGDSEIRYYSQLDFGLANSPLPNCYHTAYSPESQRYHLLLKDLSSSHKASWEHHWTTEDLPSLAEAFATFHAAWWDKPELPATVAPLPNETILQSYFKPAMAGLAPLLTAVQNRLPPTDLEIIRDVFAYHPRSMQKRAEQNHHFTCIHGDPNPGNILLPATHPGKCYLIDRQPFDWSLQTWLGVSDLAYLMVHWWPTELRHSLEIPFLQSYHSKLTELGIQDYSWEQLWNDYRLTAMQSFYVVAEWCSEPEQLVRMEWVWWPQLQKTLQAFKDLNCGELLR